MIRKTKQAGARVLGYVRVSTEEQAEHGVSLAAQRSKLKAYAQLHELELAEVIADNGISARRMANRPGLQRALGLLKAREAAGLVVLRLDRLSRTTRDVLDLVARAEREGWQLHSIHERLDTTTPAGRFAVTLLGALGQMEREQTGARTREALAELRRQGRRISRFPPFGWRFVRNRLVPVPEERRVLRRMLRLRAEGLGVLRIARRLGANPRTDRAWSAGSVYAIVRREVLLAGSRTA